MSDSTIVGLALATVAAIIYGPHVIDRARRNRRTRQARADYWNARIQWALEAGPLDEDETTRDWLVCEQLESQFQGGAA